MASVTGVISSSSVAQRFCLRLSGGPLAAGAGSPSAPILYRGSTLYPRIALTYDDCQLRDPPPHAAGCPGRQSDGPGDPVSRWTGPAQQRIERTGHLEVVPRPRPRVWVSLLGPHGSVGALELRGPGRLRSLAGGTLPCAGRSARCPLRTSSVRQSERLVPEHVRRSVERWPPCGPPALAARSMWA